MSHRTGTSLYTPFPRACPCATLGYTPYSLRFSVVFVAQNRKSGVQVAWVNVTYSSVLLAVAALVLAVAVLLHFAFPDATNAGMQVANHFTFEMLEKIAGNVEPTTPQVAAGAQQAHFTNLDGTVRVKKANSSAWSKADYSLPLEKGDIVQTASEGLAKIVFTDGTNYTVKQDSLIVIEENSANDHQQTNVAVTVNTGTVDLSTGTYTQGSKSQVMVAGATASLAPESAAMVHNDPINDQHEFLQEKGTAQVQRNGEVVTLSEWEKVSYQRGSPRMARLKEVGPPTPISPANMAPIYAAPGQEHPVEFSWSKMPNAAGYHLRVSQNPYFSSLVRDEKVAKAEIKVSGLGEGKYYWSVQSYDADDKESVVSETNRFTILPRGSNAQAAMNLELEFMQHGRVIEVSGKTEPNARVMVNGREAPPIESDGSFRCFTPELPIGDNVITVTAQNATGGSNTKHHKVLIQ